MTIQQCNKRSCGFTLIVMLLIIIILALVLLVFTNIQKQKADIQIVNTTAAEIKNYLEAAQSYYIDKGYWPCSIDDLTTATQNAFKLQNGCGKLSQVGSTTACPGHNNYQLVFPIGYGCGNPNNEIQQSLPIAQQCIIRTRLPTLNLANQIAAQLPNASVDQTLQVSASVTPPDQNQSIATLMQQEDILAITTVYNDLIGKQWGTDLTHHLGDARYLPVTLPACPVNWIPGYDNAQMQTIVNKIGSLNAFRGVNVCKTQFNFPYSAQDQSAALALKTDRLNVGDWYTGSVLVLTYCSPPAPHSNTYVAPPAWNSPDPTLFAALVNNQNASSDCYFAGTNSTP